MRDSGFALFSFPKCLLLVILLLFTGCAVARPPTSPGSTEPCSSALGEVLPRYAPDVCRKEVCVDGKLTIIEDPTATAPVSDWAEESFCFFHPIDCFRALSIKKHILQWEQDKVAAGLWDRASLQGGLGDTARHGYLSCTLVTQFGYTFAKGLLDAHEEDSSIMFGFGTRSGGNKCCYKLMDLYNNRIGMGLADQPGDCEEKTLNSLYLFRHSLCTK